MKKRIKTPLYKLNVLLIALSIFSILSCANTKMYKSVVPLKEPCDVYHSLEDFLYYINGKDKNGEEANVFILGTLHIGDEKLYPLSEDIGDCYLNADRLVAELSSSDYDNIPFFMNKKVNESAKKEVLRISNNGKSLEELLTDEQKEFLLQFIPKVELARLYKYEPWVLQMNIEQIPVALAEMSNLDGIDYNLYKLAKSDNRYVEGLDTIDLQLDIISNDSFDTQYKKLNLYINLLQEKLNEETTKLKDIYKAYVNYNYQELYNLTFSSMNGEQISTKSKYYKELVLNRNIDWADKIASYIYEGGNTFIFVGVSHLLGDDSIFEVMLKKGYVKQP